LHSESDGFCTSETERKITPPLSKEELQELENQDDNTLANILQNSSNRRVQAHALGLLWKRHGAEFEIFINDEKVPLYILTRKLYEVATACHDWAVIRRVADITGRYDDRLEDVLLDIVIGQNRLVVGQNYNLKATISKPMETTAIVKIIAEFCGDNTAERALTQEIILHLGSLIRTNPEFFENTLTLRTWHFVQLLVGQISRQTQMSMDEAYEFLLGLAPHEIYNRLHTIIKSLTDTVTDKKIDAIETDDWAFWRKEAGMFSRFSSKFYKAIWYMLQQCEGIVIGDKHNVKNRMNSELTLDVTAGERSFELRIDNLLQSITESDYRHLNIELIESLARVFRENPEMHIERDLILEDLIGQAVRVSWKSGNYDEQSKEAWEAFYKLSPKETDKAFIKAFGV
jgi:phosphorylase kinase alpha/beta subunit